MPKHNKKKISSSHTIFETAPKAIAISFISGLLLLFLSTFFALKATSPYELARPIALASLYTGAALGGVFCAYRLESGDSYIAAISASSILMLLIFAAKLFLPHEGIMMPTFLSVALHLLIPTSSLIGAFMGNCRPRTKKKRKK